MAFRWESIAVSHVWYTKPIAFILTKPIKEFICKVHLENCGCLMLKMLWKNLKRDYETTAQVLPAQTLPKKYQELFH